MNKIKSLITTHYQLKRSRWVYGISFLIFLAWLMYAPPGLLGKADAVGYAVCHRIETRSFHLGERQYPLCVRCTGMYLGAMLGIVYQSFVGLKHGGTPPLRVFIVCTVLVFGFVVDGLNSYLNLLFKSSLLYPPNNYLRLFTGTGMGLVLSILLFPAFNQTVWAKWENKPTIPGLNSLVFLLGLSGLLDAILMTENPLILYPLALISSFSVLVLLTMTYTMVWLMIFHIENRYNYFRELVLPLIGGFGMSILQIFLIDVLRYFLTGTWGGFHIG